MDDLEKILNESINELKHITKMYDLDQIKSKYIGKSGRITAFMQQLRSLPIEERKELGAQINRVKNQFEELLQQQKELKLKEIESKEKIAEGKKLASKKDNNPIMQQNNFLFTGPREAVFDLLSNKPEEREKALLKLQEMNPPIDV